MLIAQISDPHIRPAGQLYQGVADSNRMFEEAIDHLHGLDRKPDLVLLTGDLVDDGRPDEYAQVRHLLAKLTIPYLVIPGNHDHRENFRAAFADHAYLPAEGALHYSSTTMRSHRGAGLVHSRASPWRHRCAGLAWLQRSSNRSHQANAADAASPRPS